MPNVSKKNKPRHMSGKQAKRTARIDQGPDSSFDRTIKEPITVSPPAVTTETLLYQPAKLQAKPTRGPRTSATLQTNYDYVVKDLKRIGITAVCILAAMVVLAFIIPMISL